MNEEDRKKVFWLLKKYSSYTAWAALGEAYANFVKAWEYAMGHADDIDVDRQNIGWTKKILDGQIAFEKGLPLLREGQRSVFREVSTGFLNNSYDTLCNFIRRIMDPDEFDFDWMKNKEDVIAAFHNFERLTEVYVVTEPPASRNVAPFRATDALDPEWHILNFPPALPDVPSPTDTTVNTGEEIPITGAWEPEWEISAGFIKALTGTQPRLEKGCMNYLLAGAIAPRYRDSELDLAFDVRWRLIWADHRYEDGTIPEEEKDYLAEVPEPGQERLRGLPSEAVPKTGWWHSPALSGETGLRYFKQGERFPEAETSAYGQVIWNYDPANQDPLQA